jgi:hypothetical protein
MRGRKGEWESLIDEEAKRLRDRFLIIRSTNQQQVTSTQQQILPW